VWFCVTLGDCDVGAVLEHVPVSRTRPSATSFARCHRALAMSSDSVGALVRDDDEPVATYWRNPRFLGGSTILSIVDQDARARTCAHPHQHVHPLGAIVLAAHGHSYCCCLYHGHSECLRSTQHSRHPSLAPPPPTISLYH
jgi:hypothetical protein